MNNKHGFETVLESRCWDDFWAGLTFLCGLSVTFTAVTDVKRLMQSGNTLECRFEHTSQGQSVRILGLLQTVRNRYWILLISHVYSWVVVGLWVLFFFFPQ